MDFAGGGAYARLMDALRKWILLVALGTLSATAAQAADSYRWKDLRSGQTVFSPIPPKDPNQPYVLMRDGIVVAAYEGSERLVRPDSEFDAQLAAEEAQRKADALLQVQYKNLEDIEEAMEVELENLRYDFNLIDGTYDSLEKSLFEQLEIAADRQRAGLKVPARTKEKIRALRVRMEANRENREGLDVREQQIRQEYDGKRDRYRYLLEQQSTE
ncbi:MAG: hypothetical protein AAGH19_12395 [Pseudomonadota bacterium]